MNNKEERKIITGIYSGSFNPIHIGHLALANWLCEFTELEEIWFVVTPHNPLKTKEDLYDDNLRLEWVRKSIENFPKFTASDFEFHLPTPSYSIDTLRALRSKYPDREFCFIIGADNWKNFYRWKDHDKILSEFPIYIYPRPGYDIYIPDEYKAVYKVDAPLIDISSSFVRKSLNEGKDVRFFLPSAIRGSF